MGQRLVITLRKDNREIAKIYYQWSGYTISAYLEACDLLRYIDPNSDVEDILFGAIKGLTQNIVVPFKKYGGIQTETKFGGVDPSDIELEFIYIKEHYPKLYERYRDEICPLIRDNVAKGFCLSRTCGVMTVDPSQFPRFDRDAEETMLIDFDNGRVDNGAFDVYDYNEWEELMSTDVYIIPLSNMPSWVENVPFSMFSVPINRIGYATAIAIAMEHRSNYVFNDHVNEQVIVFIS